MQPCQCGSGSAVVAPWWFHFCAGTTMPSPSQACWCCASPEGAFRFWWILSCSPAASGCCSAAASWRTAQSRPAVPSAGHSGTDHPVFERLLRRHHLLRGVPRPCLPPSPMPCRRARPPGCTQPPILGCRGPSPSCKSQPFSGIPRSPSAHCWRLARSCQALQCSWPVTLHWPGLHHQHCTTCAVPWAILSLFGGHHRAYRLRYQQQEGWGSPPSHPLMAQDGTSLFYTTMAWPFGLLCPTLESAAAEAAED